MFRRIVSDPVILGGTLCVKGTRISVEMILEWVASGARCDDVAKSCPQWISRERGGIAQLRREIAQQRHDHDCGDFALTPLAGNSDAQPRNT
jgi:hypothetical protein